MLSIAIATMKRWFFLKESLPQMLDRPEVGEVVVSDETGEDAAAILASPFGKHPKLRVSVNERILGIYENKLKAAKMATLPWVAILDSDNLFPENWFFTISEVLESYKGKPMIFASAEFQNVDLETGESNCPCKSFSGLMLDKSTWNSVFQKERWNYLLNDGNWVVPREAIAVLPTHIKSSDVLAADAIFMLKEWIRAGYMIWYLPDLVYIHTRHPGSSWIQTAQESTRIFNQTDWRL